MGGQGGRLRRSARPRPRSPARRARHRLSTARLAGAAQDPGRVDRDLLADRAAHRRAESRACGSAGLRRERDRRRHSLPPRRAQRRRAFRLPLGRRAQAGASTRRAEEAVDGEGARFIVGPWSSGVALAVSEVAKRKKVVHLFSGGTEDISGARCHRYSFQWAASPYTAAKTVVDNFMKANPKAKRWHLLVADYAFGWSVEKYIKEVGKTHGLEFVGADRHPLGEREFSNYVQKAAANKPDVVAMINFGGDAVAGAREIFNFGLTPKLPLIMCWSSGVEELIQLAPEIRDNLWVGTNFYYTADTPVAKEFVKNYRAKFGTPPGYAPSAAYSMTRLMLAGFDKAKSAEVA